jgi:hypothetical protein
MADNAFVRIADWQRPQTLADALSPKDLHRVLDGHAAQCCPVLDVIGQSYHWSLMQVEYSTDLVFRSQAMLAPLYEQLARQAVLNVKAEHVATVLATRSPGNWLRKSVAGSPPASKAPASSTVSASRRSNVRQVHARPTSGDHHHDVSSFKHHRKVEHRKGPTTRDLAPVKKTIYSLPDLREILLGCNRRYFTFLSALDDFSAGARAFDRLTTPHVVAGKTVKGINFFNPMEQRLLSFSGRPSISPAFAAPTFCLSSTSSLPPR